MSKGAEPDLVFEKNGLYWLVEFKIRKGIPSCWVLVFGRDCHQRPAFFASMELPIAAKPTNPEELFDLIDFVDWAGLTGRDSERTGYAELIHKPEASSRRALATALIEHIFASDSMSAVESTFFAYSAAKGLGVSSPIELIAGVTGVGVNTLKKRVSRSRDAGERNA